jgi:hypothetical protein
MKKHAVVTMQPGDDSRERWAKFMDKLDSGYSIDSSSVVDGNKIVYVISIDVETK